MTSLLTFVRSAVAWMSAGAVGGSAVEPKGELLSIPDPIVVGAFVFVVFVVAPFSVWWKDKQRADAAEEEAKRLAAQRPVINARMDKRRVLSRSSTGIQYDYVVIVKNDGTPATFHANMSVINGPASLRLDPRTTYRMEWEDRGGTEVRLPNGGEDSVRFAYKFFVTGSVQGGTNNALQANWGLYLYDAERCVVEKAGDEQYYSVDGEERVAGNPLIVEVRISTDPMPATSEAWVQRFRVDKNGCDPVNDAG